MADISTPLVRRWIVDLKQRGLANSSIARHVYALRSYWAFLRDNDTVTHDPLRRVSTPKRQQTIPTCLTIDEARLLLAAAATHRDHVVAARDYAMMCTFVFAGLRRGELLNLEIGDVAFDAGTLYVRHAKGGKARGVPLLTDAVDAIRSWLLVRPAKMNSFLFTTVCGNRIHPTRMQIIWKRVLRDSGITKQGVSVNLGANGRRKAEQREQSLVVLPARRRGRNAAGLPPV